MIKLTPQFLLDGNSLRTVLDLVYIGESYQYMYTAKLNKVWITSSTQVIMHNPLTSTVAIWLQL